MTAMTTNRARRAAAVAQWLAALREADFGQANGYLRRDDDYGKPHYCCLGVACEISGIGDWYDLDLDPDADGSEWTAIAAVRAYAILADGDDDLDPELLDPGFIGHTRRLPAEVRYQLGLSTETGEYVATPEWLVALARDYPEAAATLADANLYLAGGGFSLASLNDAGIPFAVIADVIESNPQGLFE